MVYSQLIQGSDLLPAEASHKQLLKYVIYCPCGMHYTCIILEFVLQPFIEVDIFLTVFNCHSFNFSKVN